MMRLSDMGFKLWLTGQIPVIWLSLFLCNGCRKSAKALYIGIGVDGKKYVRTVGGERLERQLSNYFWGNLK